MYRRQAGRNSAVVRTAEIIEIAFLKYRKEKRNDR